jgi:ABC-type transporter Mla maintaining outer membrane lipid asymmetry ATPase subunit MlaF
VSEEDPLLSLEAVDAGYREEVPVLRGIDLELARGEILGLVSLDAGGGKTTLLRVAAGLHAPWAGRVRFDGVDVYAMGFRADQAFRARCAVVLEGGALLVNQTVWDNVALPLRYHRGLRGRELTLQVKRLLDLTGFEEDAHLFPWQVSGRGRRLAAFSRALSRDPSLVLVDRFFEGLEMPDWKRLFELVLELNHSQGVAWILGSEVDPVLFQAAERVLVLDQGAVLACARP